MNSSDRCGAPPTPDELIADLARPLLDVFDQFGNRMDRQLRIDHQDERRLHVERDRHEVLLRVVGRLLSSVGRIAITALVATIRV